MRMRLVALAREGTRQLRTPGFSRRVLLLSGGTAAGQVIALAGAPFVVRMYSPSEYGVLGVYVSALSILSVVSMLRYEFALPVAAEASEVAALSRLTVRIAAISSLICLIAVAALKDSVTRLVPGVAPLTPYLWLLPLGILAMAFYQTLAFRALRLQDMATLARTKVSQNVAMIGVQLGTGLLHGGPLGLISGYLIGQAGGALTLWRSVGWHGARGEAPLSLAIVARRYSRFPKLSAPAALLDTLTINVPLLAFVGLYGTGTGGLVTLAQRVLLVPINYLGQSVTQVFFAELAEVSRTAPHALPLLLRRRLIQLSVTGSALMAALALVSLTVVPRVFGQQWAESGWCVVMLAPMVLTGFIAQPFGAVLDVLQRQDLHLVRELVKGALLVLLVACLVMRRMEWRQALVLIGVIGAVSNLWSLSLPWLAIAQLRRTG